MQDFRDATNTGADPELEAVRKDHLDDDILGGQEHAWTWDEKSEMIFYWCRKHFVVEKKVLARGTGGSVHR